MQNKKSTIPDPPSWKQTIVIMPDHFHGIVVVNDGGAHGRAPVHTKSNSKILREPRSLGSFVAGFKAVTSKRINLLGGTPGAKVWQRNYWERVVRDEKDLNRLREYIVQNPSNWGRNEDNIK